MRVEHAIAAVAEITGTELSPQAIAMMAADLAEHPEADVMAALTRCRRELKGRLTLADVLERLPEARGEMPTFKALPPPPSWTSEAAENAQSILDKANLSETNRKRLQTIIDKNRASVP